jgi:hypothetical protein
LGDLSEDPRALTAVSSAIAFVEMVLDVHLGRQIRIAKRRDTPE